MVLIEILLSVHILLLMSAFCIRGQWLVNHPSLKLKLLRILLVSCLLSPIVVQSLGHNEKPKLLQFTSLDSLQVQVQKPLFKSSQKINHTKALPSFYQINYWQLVCVFYCIVVLWGGVRFLLNLKALRAMLQQAQFYRKSGRLIIKISHQCHIPFSVSFLNKAFIVLPVSLLSSPNNLKIAIAHEGQHHRNGDCLWAYLMELIQILFIGNPGLKQWTKIISDLQEFSCDEVLVGRQNISAYDYGHCLYDVVQTVSQYSQPTPRDLACTVGMAKSNKTQETAFIARRITMLSNYQKLKTKPTLISGIVLGLTILLPIGSAFSTMGSLTGNTNKAINLAKVDLKTQTIASFEIEKAVKETHAKSGAIAIANPTTGEIIAFAQTGDVNGNHSWKTRVFSPGSTIKPFVAAVALDAKTSTPSKQYDCHSPYSVHGVSFTNYNSKFDSATLEQALAQSVNTCFVKVAQEIGAHTLRQKLANIGFDTKNGWQTNQAEALQVANASLGVNIPVTLESLLNTYAVLANNGQVQGKQVISEATAKSVTHMLETAVKEGTGIKAFVPGLNVAGKTGTLSQTNDDSHLALFAGYVTSLQKNYVIVVVIENGGLNRRESTGGELAAPVFRNVVERLKG